MFEEKIPELMDRFEKFQIISHTYPNAIGLWKNEQECLLWAALNSNPNFNWLEIGSFHGGSAVLMCLARQVLSNKPYILSMDRFFDPMFDKNIQFGQLNYLSKKLIGDSLFYEKIFDNSELSLALIDGWHSFKGAYIDFQNINKTLVKGGFVLFHDVDLFQSENEIDYYYKLALKNYNKLMAEPLPNNNANEQSFHLEELTAFIINEYGFKLIKPPILNGIKRPSNVWKPGTPLTNSLVILQKP